jgi:hypothetical protein
MCAIHGWHRNDDILLLKVGSGSVRSVSLVRIDVTLTWIMHALVYLVITVASQTLVGSIIIMRVLAYLDI